MKTKILKYAFVLGITSIFVIGCGTNEMKESTFECTNLTAGSNETENVVLTYKEENGEKIFYDGDTKIGTRIYAIEYAEQKTGMTCKSGSDR